MIHFKTEFHNRFKSGDKIKVTLPKYFNIGHYSKVNQEYITRHYTIGRTDLDESHGQVELFFGIKMMVVEYQWFNEELTNRKIEKDLVD